MKSSPLPIGLFLAAACTSLHAEIILGGNGLVGPASGSFGTAGIIREFNVISDPGLSWTASSAAGAGYLLLAYSATAPSMLVGARALAFLDAEIDEGNGAWFNERGEALAASGGATSWEIDEPGYVFGDIFSNFRLGAFDNSIFGGDVSLADDVALGLGFAFGDLRPGDQLLWELMLSEAPVSPGWGTVLHQWDGDDATQGNHLYFAGRSSILTANPPAIPEPASWALFLLGLGSLAILLRRVPPVRPSEGRM